MPKPPQLEFQLIAKNNGKPLEHIPIWTCEWCGAPFFPLTKIGKETLRVICFACKERTPH